MKVNDALNYMLRKGWERGDFVNIQHNQDGVVVRVNNILAFKFEDYNEEVDKETIDYRLRACASQWPVRQVEDEVVFLGNSCFINGAGECINEGPCIHSPEEVKDMAIKFLKAREQPSFEVVGSNKEVVTVRFNGPVPPQMVTDMLHELNPNATPEPLPPLEDNRMLDGRWEFGNRRLEHIDEEHPSVPNALIRDEWHQVEIVPEPNDFRHALAEGQRQSKRLQEMEGGDPDDILGYTQTIVDPSRKEDRMYRIFQRINPDGSYSLVQEEITESAFNKAPKLILCKAACHVLTKEGEFCQRCCWGCQEGDAPYCSKCRKEMLDEAEQSGDPKLKKWVQDSFPALGPHLE